MISSLRRNKKKKKISCFSALIFVCITLVCITWLEVLRLSNMNRFLLENSSDEGSNGYTKVGQNHASQKDVPTEPKSAQTKKEKMTKIQPVAAAAAEDVHKVEEVVVPPPPTEEEATPEVPEEEDTVEDKQTAPEGALAGAVHESVLDEEWASKVCNDIQASICHQILVVNSRKATFCSAAKVASTTTKQYFYDIADRGSDGLIIPHSARFGVHEANWKRFAHLSKEERMSTMRSRKWTHIFFYRNVLERFVSGFLDKVVRECKQDPTDKPYLAIYHYIQYGFSCEKHTDIEEFVNFIEKVVDLEDHFAPQTPLCDFPKFPYTDVIPTDKTLSKQLKSMSAKLGVEHPAEKKTTSTHKTGAKEKMVVMFKDKPHLIQKILNLFKEDCDNLPESCNVEDIMAEIAMANQ